MLKRLRSAWIAYRRGVRFHLLKRERAKLGIIRQQNRDFRQQAFEGRQDLLRQQIGMITMGWTQLELSLDACIRLIHRHGGAKAIQPDLPVSLKAKIPYLRKAVRKLPAVEALAGQANNLADEIQRLKKVRHDCTHGWAFVDPDKFEVTFRRIVFNKADLSVAENRYNLLQIGDNTTAILLLFRSGVALFADLAHAFGDEQAIEVGRQLTVSFAADGIPSGNQV
jgi:hypothetical protein